MSNLPFIAWPVSGLEKVFSDAEAPSRPADRIDLRAATGECEVAQIAVHARDDELLLHAPRSSSLRCGNEVIEAESVQCRFVDLVPVRFNTQGVPSGELVRAAPGYFPDPLCLEQCMHVPRGQTRAIWVRVKVPTDTAPGEYGGEIIVATDRGEVAIDLSLTVWPVRLPEKIPFGLTLWVWPFLIAKYHCVQLYGESFWTLLDRYAVEMAEHRQDTIFTPIVGPDALIDVIRQRDGRYRFEFDNFDRWVKIFLGAGFTRIEGGHVYDDSIKFQRITDEVTGACLSIEKGVAAENFDESDEYVDLLRQLLRALREHLQRQGWQNHYVQHIFDEPQGPMVAVYLQLANVIRDVWPEVKFIDAADADPALFEVIDILVPLVDHRSAFQEAERFANAGKSLWCYTSNHPRGGFPGTYLDLDLLKVRIIPWIMWRYGVSGFLFYALGYWEVQFPVDRHRFDPYGGECDDSITLYNPWLDPAQNATWRCPPGSWGFCYPPRDPYSQDPRILAPRMIENFNRLRGGEGSNPEDEGPLAEHMRVLPGPVGSIRWEQLREGVEDYGLLCVLQSAIDTAPPEAARRAREAVHDIVHEIAPDWEHYTRRHEDIDRARLAVVEQITSLRGDDAAS